MGFFDDLFGKSSADAAKKAAADTYAKQQAATTAFQGATANYAPDMANAGRGYASGMGDLGAGYATNFSDLSKGFQPWSSTGQDANDALKTLIANPDSVRSLPGYQATLDAGTRALDHSAVAGGTLFSGKQGKALVGYGQGLFDKTYGDQLSRLLGVSQQGLDATGRSIATAGQGYTGGLGAATQGLTGGLGATTQGLTGKLGADTSAYGGQMGSAGTIGQGDIAAANAKSSALQNLMNIGGFLGGSALSGGGLGKLTSGFKGGFNSLFGGGSPSGYGS